MNFYGSYFIFDGKPSELYDLRIYDFNPSNPSEGDGGGTVNVAEEWLYRRTKPYFYGTYYQNSLEFDMTVGSFSYIDGDSRNAIQTWLLGKTGYGVLRIVQDDIASVYFNVIFTSAKPIYVGNLNYAIKLHAKCDAPWGFYNPPDYVRTYSSTDFYNNYVSETISYFNSSSYNGYTYPIISFTMPDDIVGPPLDENSPYSPLHGQFKITNESDGNREFYISSTDDGETITVDNDKQIITSSLGISRLGDFNKQFFRLVRGENILKIEGIITTFTISATVARAIGV